jgi:hypothetical protein
LEGGEREGAVVVWAIAASPVNRMVAVAPGVRVLELSGVVVGLDIEEVGGQRPDPVVGGSVARQ